MKKSWLFLALAIGCAQTTEFGASKESAKESGGKGDDGIDLCAFYGWYGDGVCDDWCPQPDTQDCETSCPDAADPNVEYLGDAQACSVIRFTCDEGEAPFSNECGCGCIKDDEPGDDCSAQDAAGEGDCRAIIGYIWDGQSCSLHSGCSCIGTECDQVFESIEACRSAYASCSAPTQCCDMADYPPYAVEGAHCCADGTWAYDNGNGRLDGECDANQGPGMVCEEPSACDAPDAMGAGDCRALVGYAWNGAFCQAEWGCSCGGTECDQMYSDLQSCQAAYASCEQDLCCDPNTYPDNAREGAHCCADGTWAYDNGNGKYDGECDYDNGGEGTVCESLCPALDFSIACINPATYECRAGTLPYDGALEGCECGCIKSDACLDPDAAGVEYIGNTEFCTRADFACDTDEDPFWNDCGCGCVAN